MMHSKKLGILAAVATALTMIACGGGDSTGASSADVTSAALALHAEASPLADFKYDTGLLPADSPAQVELKLSAGGGLKIDAAADRGPNGLTGKQGGGKLALDIHVKMDGRLKVDSTFKSYDGDLPGLKDIDIPIGAVVPFDGFLLGDGETAAVTADLPETTLPEIPLGSIPGSLVITVAKGSTLTSTFHGSCLSVTGGQATYTGEAKTTGTLVLKAKIVLKLPVPLNKSVDLPEITIPVPAVTTKVEGASPVAGIADAKQGACGAAAAADPAASGKAPSSSTPSAPDGGAAACNAVKNIGVFVPVEVVSGPVPTAAGGVIADGTYVLTAFRIYTTKTVDMSTEVKRTIVVSKGKVDGITEDETGAIETASGSYATAGTTLTRTYSCPAPVSTDTPTYSATKSSLTMYFPPTADVPANVSFTYAKQ